MVLLSHDLDVVRALADEVLVMRAGPGRGVRPRGAAVARAPARLDPPTPRRTAGTRRSRHRQRTDARQSGRGLARPAPRRRPQHHRVLRVLELTLRAGECLAVVGRSGSGKTTLARCLAGLHRDHDRRGPARRHAPARAACARRTREQLAAVQYVFQDAQAAFDEHRPVLDQVARTAVRLRGAGDRARGAAEALTTLTGLGLTEELVAARPASSPAANSSGPRSPAPCSPGRGC